MECNCAWAAWKGFAGWYCKEGYESCVFNKPDSKECAKVYNYGPDAEEKKEDD